MIMIKLDILKTIIYFKKRLNYSFRVTAAKPSPLHYECIIYCDDFEKLKIKVYNKKQFRLADIGQ